MISYIRGRLSEKFEESLIVETGGIGYQIQVPFSLLSEAVAGEEIQIYTYLHIGQDQAPRLYGFSSREDLDVFKLLIGVNGIGPKGAIGVLSVISPDDLRYAVLLKDKFKLEDAFEQKRSHEEGKANSGAGASSQDKRGEAVQALAALGYSASEAMKAVNQVKGAGEMEVEDILKAALRQMALF